MDLTQEFQKHVGKIIKDPDRMACDCDAVADEINDEAIANGVKLQFLKVGSPAKIDAGTPKILCVITQDGVPGDKPWGWRVKEIAFI